MKLKRLLKHTLWGFLSIMVTGLIFVAAVLIYFATQLPDIDKVKDFRLQVPLKIYSADGKLIGEFGSKRRNPVPLESVPKPLINAVVATEDQRFFEHGGVDPIGLLRASVELVSTGEKLQGGSTITMQVARNFFLTRKKTYSRKIKEIMLAIKIDHEFSKETILELYLNKIYYGNRAYGISAAAYVYYGKSLNQLSLAELAMIAGIPKAPSKLNPVANPDLAMTRRNHVLLRMFEHDFITKKQYEQAIAEPNTASFHGEPIELDAPYVAEMVRDALVAHFGKDAYAMGLNVRTTINSKDQLAANHALRKALIAYDKRHGYRGPLANIGSESHNPRWKQLVAMLQDIKPIAGMQPAVIISADEKLAIAQLANGERVHMTADDLVLAARRNHGKTPAQIVRVGDVIRVKHTKTDHWRLTQLPEVEGALVALDPKDGSILALTGGFSFASSNYNRVIQAMRQPGSAFKPFIYAAALSKGYTLASIVNDAPVVIDDPTQKNSWRPQNDTHQFYGPTRLRIGLIKSRNLVSIRLLENITPQYAVNFASRFGFDPDKLPKTLSLALGSATITPMELANGYAVFANGGYRVNPYFIQEITDYDGKSVYKATPKLACIACATEGNKALDSISETQRAPQVMDPRVAYLINDVMQDVIQNGTGHGAIVLKRHDLAGKTGTTNDQVDAWFSGFNRDIVVTAWVGYDKPRSLHEYGADAALPMWISFMKKALENMPENSMSTPPGIVSVRIDPNTGLLARAGQADAIFEVFRREDVPKQYATQNNGADLSHEGNANEHGDGGSDADSSLF